MVKSRWTFIRGGAAAVLVAAGVAMLIACASLPLGPSRAAEPLITSNFSTEVMIAAQHSAIGVSPLMPGRQWGVAGLPRPSPRETQMATFTLEPTQESLLSGLRQMCSPEPAGSRVIRQRIAEDPAPYVMPLLEMVEDDEIEVVIRVTAASLLIGSGSLPDGLLAPERDALKRRIFDAIIAVERIHPGAMSGVLRGSQLYITPDRIETLVSLIESATPKQREALIDLFGKLTHTAWPTVPRMFCGNSSQHSVEQAIAQGQAKQAAAVPKIRAWWEANQHKTDQENELVGLETLLDEHLQQIEKYADYDEPDYLEWAIRHEPSIQKRRLTEAVLPTLEQRYETCDPRMRPGILQLLIRIGGYERYEAFVKQQLDSDDPHLTHVAQRLIDLSKYDEPGRSETGAAQPVGATGVSSQKTASIAWGKLVIRAKPRVLIPDPQLEKLPQTIEEYRAGRNLSRYLLGGIPPFVQLGVPNLTPAIARELLGHNGRADMWLVEYCYNKYGNEALPLVREFVETYAGQGMYFWVAPFWEILRQSEVDMRPLERLLVKRLRANDPKGSDWIPLLGTFEDRRSARFIGRLLKSDERWQVMRAAEAAGRRGLSQHADRLAQIHQITAVIALARLDDPRALDVLEPAIRAVSGGRIATPRDESLAYYVGRELAALKTKHRASLFAKFRQTLINTPQGDPSAWEKTLLTMATVAAIQPTAEDLRFLREVVNAAAPHQVRTVAAVTLANAGEADVLPVLHEMAVEAMQQPGGLINPGREWPFTEAHLDQLPGIDPVFSDRHYPTEPELNNCVMPLELNDIGLALRGLNDTSFLPTVIEHLQTPAGQPNYTALQILAGMTGPQTSHILAEHFGASNPTLYTWLKAGCLRLFEYDLDAEHLATLFTLEELVANAQKFPARTHFPAALSDALVAAYEHSQEHREGWRGTRYLALLCRQGDQRGLDLAMDDPLQLAVLSWALADAPLSCFVRYGLVLNRCEDAMVLQQWYREHRDRLSWDAEAGVWRLAERMD